MTNRIVSMDGNVRDLLQKSYPGTDFDKCLIIQEGRTPFSREIVYLFAAGAFVALLAAVGAFIGAWRDKA